MAAGRTTTALSTAGLKPAATADIPLRLRQPQLFYGSWTNSSDTQHSARTNTCGYSTYEYASHIFMRLPTPHAPFLRVRRSRRHERRRQCDGCSKELTVYVDVTLDACGGVLADDEVTVIFGDTYGELPEPTREGYTFDGWYTEKDGGELVEAGTEVSDKTRTRSMPTGRSLRCSPSRSLPACRLPSPRTAWSRPAPTRP